MGVKIAKGLRVNQCAESALYRTNKDFITIMLKPTTKFK